MAGMRDEMDRIFNDFFSRSPVSYEGIGTVSMDMMQTDEDVIVKASVPVSNRKI
jgi:HSP20 family molecular chaperone IbpA